MKDLLGNQIILCCIASWIVAQVSKTLIDWRITRVFNIRKLIKNGGMPSAHTAVVVSLSIMVALKEGLGSTAFAICCVVTAVVINDAIGVRYHTGEQSKVLNKIIHRTIIEGQPITDETLQELVGHTPTEAFFGALIGILMPLLFR